MLSTAAQAFSTRRALARGRAGPTSLPRAISPAKFAIFHRAEWGSIGALARARPAGCALRARRGRRILNTQALASLTTPTTASGSASEGTTTREESAPLAPRQSARQGRRGQTALPILMGLASNAPLWWFPKMLSLPRAANLLARTGTRIRGACAFRTRPSQSR